MTPPGRAHALSLAFMRYLELHGRSVTVPRDGCAVRTAGSTMGQTVILDFWSRKAADEFDYFWRRYRPTYGEIDAAEAKARRFAAA